MENKIKGEWEEHTTVTKHFVVDTFSGTCNLPNDFCAWHMKEEMGSEQAVLDYIKKNWGLKKLDFTFADLMNNEVNIDLCLSWDDDHFNDADCLYMEDYAQYMNEKYKTDKFYYEEVPLRHDDCYFIICYKKGDKNE